MRRRSQQDAYDYAWLCKNHYTQDNQWAVMLTGGDTKAPPPEFEKTVVAASLAYARVPNDKNAILLLGDTKIRSDAELMTSFGLAGPSGADPDPDTTEVILKAIKAMGDKDLPADAPLSLATLVKYREKIEAKQKDNVLKGITSKTVPFFGPGSLLSDPSWSPILNDAFILGGINTNLLFVLALNKDEQARWATHKVGAVASLAKRYGGQTEQKKESIAREAWLTFLLENQRIVWDPKLNIPRVFLRELMGLKKFGYSPQFSEYQLSFVCSDVAKADEANFFPYVDHLSGAGFKDTSKKAELLSDISGWLFNDEKALDPLVTGAKS